MDKNKNKGISLMEILIVVSILIAIVAITIPNLSDFHNKQALKNTTEDIISLLNEARSNTVSSINSTTYGVHFESDKATLFSGFSFSSLPTNKQIDFDSTVSIPVTGGINLNGGGSDIVFDRITGDTSKDGTIVLQLKSDSTSQKIITINKVGAISKN